MKTSIVSFLLLSLASTAFAETMTLTTYYPEPLSGTLCGLFDVDKDLNACVKN
jgi:hypothetical protein